MLEFVKDLTRYRFPQTLNPREQFFVYVARNRCVLALVLGFVLGLIF